MRTAICFTILSVFLVGGFVKAEVSTPIAAERIADYVNHFNSIESVVQNYVSISLISEKDASNILNFLQTKGLDTKAHIPKIISLDEKYTVGAVTIKRQADGNFKSSNGAIIKFAKTESAFQKYKKAFEILENEKQVSLLNLFFPMAQAQVKVLDKNGNIGAALLGMLLDTGINSFKNTTNGFYIVIDGIGGVTKEAYYSAIELINNGKIVCNGAEYAYLQGSSNKNKTYTDLSSAKHICEANGDKTGSCELLQRVVYFYEHASDKTADKANLSKETKDAMANYFPNRLLPKCTAENAEKVQDSLKVEAAWTAFKIKNTGSKASGGYKDSQPSSKAKSVN